MEGRKILKLATKLKISFIVIIVVPMTLVFMFLLALGKYRMEAIEDRYNVKVKDYLNILNTTRMLDIVTESLREYLIGLNDIGQADFEDVEFLNSVNRDFGHIPAYIIVYDNGDFIYNGMREGDADITSLLPIYTQEKDVSVSTYYVGNGDAKYLVKPMVYADNDNSVGTVYIAVETNHILPEVKIFIWEFVIACILIMIVLGSCLTLWIYKGVLKPIRNLNKATKDIIDGNLDFTIETSKNDEFGELCDSFENMRKYLKASIDENMQYDSESKELISNISHDLKTPITAIKGYVEGIMDGVADTPEKMNKYIKTIYNKANEMDRLIGELTVYSKIDTNTIPYNFIKLNVAEYFEDCLEELKMELENSSFLVSYFNYIAKDTCVMADPEQLRRVINNIIGNSLKYNDKERGVIIIRIKDQGEYVHFEFEDNGKGVSPEGLPYIFERFYRADTSRNSKKGGSGIGLSIVKKIIEVHGGTIWAFSKENTGLSIHFILKKANANERKRKDVDGDGKQKDIDS